MAFCFAKFACNAPEKYNDAKYNFAIKNTHYKIPLDLF